MPTRYNIRLGRRRIATHTNSARATGWANEVKKRRAMTRRHCRLFFTEYGVARRTLPQSRPHPIEIMELNRPLLSPTQLKTQRPLEHPYLSPHPLRFHLAPRHSPIPPPSYSPWHSMAAKTFPPPPPRIRNAAFLHFCPPFPPPPLPLSRHAFDQRPRYAAFIGLVDSTPVCRRPHALRRKKEIAGPRWPCCRAGPGENPSAYVAVPALADGR